MPVDYLGLGLLPIFKLGFLILNYMNCLHILNIKLLFCHIICRCFFSQSIGGPFILLMVSFAVQKILSLAMSYLFLFLLLFILPWETDLKKLSVIEV